MMLAMMKCNIMLHLHNLKSTEIYTGRNPLYSTPRGNFLNGGIMKAFFYHIAIHMTLYVSKHTRLNTLSTIILTFLCLGGWVGRGGFYCD